MVEEKFELDTCKEMCPMPLLMTKRKLEGMNSGEILEVKGDFAPAFDNIKRWAKNAGHEIFEASKSPTEFKIKIRKH
jgi:tRNA 2-thiouridine synthesizing protein A